MRFIDDLIVKAAIAIFRGVMAAGAGLVYVQLFALTFVLVLAGVAALMAVLTAAKTAIFGG